LSFAEPRTKPLDCQQTSRLATASDPLRLEPTDPIPPVTVTPIAPGADAEIALSDDWHDELKAFLARAGIFPESQEARTRYHGRGL